MKVTSSSATGLSQESSILLDRIEAVIRPVLASSGMAIAFSGGVDSRFLSYTAARLAQREGLPIPMLVHICGPHIPLAESMQARQWGAAAGLRLIEVPVNPLEIPEVAANSRERCYYCKRLMFTRLNAALNEYTDIIVCDGSNASDHEGYRPGLRALRELGVRSPLDEAGLVKDDIRRLAADTGMDRPWQAARPCLLTRFPYGMPPTEEALRHLELLETQVASVLEQNGISSDFRVRMKENGDCMLQLGPGESADIEDLLRQKLDLAEIVIQRTEHLSGYFDRGAQ